MSTSATTSTIKVKLTTTLSMPTSKSLHPQAGSEAMSEHLQRYARDSGIVLEDTQIHLLTIARPNPNEDEDLAPTHYTVLDRNGRPMPSRQFTIAEANGTLRYLLMLQEGENETPWRLHSAHANMDHAINIAQDWQEGRTDISLEALPEYELPAPQRQRAGTQEGQPKTH